MKANWNHKYAKNFMAVVGSFCWLLALILTGCSSVLDDEVASTQQTLEEGDSIKIQLRLNIPSSGYTTRATESYYEGTDYENYIDPSKVCMFLGDQSSNGGICSMKFVTSSVEADPFSSNEYLVTGYVDPELIKNSNWVRQNITQTYSIALQMNLYVVVNTNTTVASLPNLITVNQTCYINRICTGSGYFSYGLQTETDASGTVSAVTFNPSKDTPIPMYGWRHVGTVKLLKANTINDFGTVTLVRAMSKVTIRGSKGVTLSNVKLSNVYQNGYATPYGIWWDASNTSITGTIRPTSSTLNVPGVYSTSVAATILKDYAFQKATDSEGEYWYAYVPEYNNLTSLTNNTAKLNTDNEAKITFDMTYSDESGDVTVSKEVQFRDYSDSSKYYDLVRNTHYDYTVTPAGLKYAVLDWDTYTSGTISFE